MNINIVSLGLIIIDIERVIVEARNFLEFWSELDAGGGRLLV